MTLWDLLFTNQKISPAWVWSLVFHSAGLFVGGWLLFHQICTVQKLPTLLVLGTVDPSPDHQCLVYSRPHAFDG